MAEYAQAAYAAKEGEFTPDIMRKVEQFVVLKTIDSKWISYLTMMEHFKEGIGLRAFGQKDPLVEYKNEAFQAFQELLNDIQFEIASNMYRVQVRTEPPVPTPPPAVLAANRGRPGRPTATAVNSNGGGRPPAGCGRPRPRHHHPHRTGRRHQRTKGQPTAPP